jgi:hypothetical protein
LDADDLAVPERLAMQVDLLEKGGVDLCGSDHWTLNQVSGRMKPSRQPSSNADILALLSVFSPLCNPSVMGKLDLFRQFPYKDSYRHAEDYCLWTELAIAGCCFANIKSRLIIYRVHKAQTSITQLEAARNVFVLAQANYIKSLDIPQSCFPRPLPFLERLKYGVTFLKLLNQRIHNISIKANYELYARFQFRGNGIWTPFIRLERFLIASYTTLNGRLRSK